jgi:ADP-ribose pyrophosphatase
MKPWKRIEPTIKHKIGYKNFVTKTFIQPNGNLVDYTTIAPENQHCIATIALTPDNKVIVARQYRPGPEKILDELPGGGVEAHDNGDYAIAAERELKEETGYVPETIEYLGDAYKDAYTNITWHFYFATGCTLHKDGQQLDETEHVDVHLISIEQLLENAKNARMTDTEAVLLAYEKLLTLRG